MHLQALLNSKGARLKVDGVFGIETKRAVVDHQRDHGLSWDGVVGRATWAVLAPR